MTKRILAIDPGSNEVGLYWGPGQSRTLYLTDQALSKSKRAQTPRPERLASLADLLADFASLSGEGPFDFAVYEEQFVRGGGATKALFGAVGVIEAVLTSSTVGVMSVPQSTLRKWALSCAKRICRRPDKETAKQLYAAVAQSRDCRSEMTEHEQDACVLWHFMQENGYF